jgi:lipopolysaccharide biosynthesis regulator YciM
VAGPYRSSAQLQLLRLYEIQSDWLGALRLHQDLSPALQRERAGIAAHYLCELVEQAFLTGEINRAGELLDEATRYEAASPRIALLRARLADKVGPESAAQAHYQKAAAMRPELGAALQGVAAQFRCAECGFETSAWLWRCPRCYTWDHFAKHS